MTEPNAPVEETPEQPDNGDTLPDQDDDTVPEDGDTAPEDDDGGQ